MSLTREQMLTEMGIAPLWRLRAHDTDVVAAERNEPSVAQTIAGPLKTEELRPSILDADVGGLDWERLEQKMMACRACPLYAHRRQAVPGVGDRKAKWLFIGEGPGAEEDAKGEPFVGQAGRLLDNMLLAIGLRRGEEVYIANAVKCRPPGNRTPEAEEISNCHPFLARQIELIGPRLIVLLGRSAAHSILPDERGSLASMRGKRFEYKGIPVMVTYHPAYLLRNLPDKFKAWEDLLFAKRLMEAKETPSLF